MHALWNTCFKVNVHATEGLAPADVYALQCACRFFVKKLSMRREGGHRRMPPATLNTPLVVGSYIRIVHYLCGT